MAALLRAPRIPLGASPPAAPRLLLLLLLLPPAQAAPGAHGRPLSKVVALNVNVGRTPPGPGPKSWRRARGFLLPVVETCACPPLPSRPLPSPPHPPLLSPSPLPSLMPSPFLPLPPPLPSSPLLPFPPLSHTPLPSLPTPFAGPPLPNTSPLLYVCALPTLPLLLLTGSVAFSSACGRPYIQGKIVGGVDVLERKWPWQVSVHYRGFHVCGGSIISEYWILSAAHCFDRDKNIVAFDMYVGLVDLRFASNHTQWFEVNKVIVHPTYQLYHPVGGDIALVQLKSRIVFSDSVLPVCIAPPDVNLHNVTCWATGWGLISPQGIPGWLSSLAPAFGPGHDPGVPGSSPASGSLHGACFSLCLCLCLSLSLSLMNK
ncbi:serine protease 38 isoform X2 [Vulpes vulpes]|uniref:Serine protease 38 isoform X2 n=1 Tax=Vulpes vulpes TaxID=9627 RepID=A0ABM5AZ75_VULVU